MFKVIKLHTLSFAVVAIKQIKPEYEMSESIALLKTASSYQDDGNKKYKSELIMYHFYHLNSSNLTLLVCIV